MNVHPIFRCTLLGCHGFAQAGFIKEIGISNCNASQVRRAQAEALKHGRRIAANQVGLVIFPWENSRFAWDNARFSWDFHWIYMGQHRLLKGNHQIPIRFSRNLCGFQMIVQHFSSIKRWFCDGFATRNMGCGNGEPWTAQVMFNLLCFNSPELQVS